MPDLREDFGLAIGECARAWRNKINKRLKPLGVSQAKWVTLLHLSRAPDGLVQGDLADRLGIEGPTLVRLLDRLESDGLVERRSSPTDRRCKRVVLMARARPLIRKLHKVTADLRKEVLSSFSDKDLERGLQLLIQVRELLDAA